MMLEEHQSNLHRWKPCGKRDFFFVYLFVVLYNLRNFIVSFTLHISNNSGS